MPLGIDLLSSWAIFVAIYFLGVGSLLVSPFADPHGPGLALVWIVSVIFWAWIGFYYARVTQRIRTFHFVLLTYPVIVAVSYLLYLVSFLLSLFGIEPEVTLP